MPGLTSNYEVLLDFKNDTADPATVQLQKDYGHNPGNAVLLHPGESVTLVLNAGASYRYCLKTHSNVANVTCVSIPVVRPAQSVLTDASPASARSWRDMQFDMSHVFPEGTSSWPPSWLSAPCSLVAGVTVDKLWRDVRFCMWYDA
jgi:hypothetical protein